MRRTAMLLMILLLLASNAMAAVCVRMQDSAALLDGYGNEIVSPGMYSDIVDLGGYYAALRDGKYALLDGLGNALTAAAYDGMRIENGIILARRGGFWGILNPDGSRLCDFIYTWLAPTGQGGCWALRGEINDNDSDELLLIDAMGFENPTGVYVRRFSREAGEGMLSVMTADSLYFGYCDARGDMVIPEIYEYAGTFEGGAAVVVTGGRYGLIDRTGTLVIPAEYDFMERSQSRVAARDGEGVYVFDLQGRRIAQHAGAGLEIGLIGEGYMLLGGGDVQIYGPDGGLLHTLPAGTSVSEGVNGQLIFSDGAWGEYCVWLEGTQARYQHIYPLGMAGDQAAYACMQVNTARYVNDLLGEIQLSTDMDSARWGVLNAEGTLLLDCIYESVALAGENILVCLDGQWQLISLQGDLVWSAPMQTEEPSAASES